jgi:hypothetical protein
VGSDGFDELLGFLGGQFEVLTTQKQQCDNVVVITDFDGTDVVIPDKPLVMVSRVLQ